MQKIMKPLVLLGTAAIVMACSLSLSQQQDATPSLVPTASQPPATDTDTAIVGTDTAVPQPTATPVRPAVPVSYENVSLNIPAGLAAGTTNTTVTDTEFPYINPGAGPMPQHTKIVLNDYVIEDTVLQPQILVFPAKDYAGYTDLTQKTVAALQGLKFTPGQPVPEGLPVGVLSAQVHPVTFGHGRGLAYLTQFDQAPLPINNRELIYYFHGLTADGSKYVEVILPVQAKFLPEDENPFSSLPSDGVPFTMENIQAYYQAVTAKLNATLTNKFTPPLSTLDALVQSITTH